MLKRLRQNLQTRLRPSWQRPEVAAFYGAAAGQARRLEFYRDAAVPDTLDGRFDLLVVHLVLLLLRLRGEGRDADAMSQHLFDFFAADMDRNLREMGVGDMGMARRIKAMGQAFYGRMAAYEAALKQDDNAPLMAALGNNLYRGAPVAPEVLHLMADYMRRAQASLRRQELAGLLAGAAEFDALRGNFVP